MSSNGDSPTIGKIPRAGTNKFAAIFAKRGKPNRVPAIEIVAVDRVAHEKESSLPATLVDGLNERTAPLRAAGGDDELMSQPPAKKPV